MDDLLECLDWALIDGKMKPCAEKFSGYDANGDRRSTMKFSLIIDGEEISYKRIYTPTISHEWIIKPSKMLAVKLKLML